MATNSRGEPRYREMTWAEMRAFLCGGAGAYLTELSRLAAYEAVASWAWIEMRPMQ